MENVSKWSFSFLLKTHSFYIWAAAGQRPTELAPSLHGRGKKMQMIYCAKHWKDILKSVSDAENGYTQKKTNLRFPL